MQGRSEAVSDWIGIGGGRGTGRSATDPTLIQAGVSTTVGRSGATNHYSWVETLPQQATRTPLAVRPGDAMSVSITRAGQDRWSVRLANGTTGRHWTTTVPYRSSRSSADWITERPDFGGVSAPLPNRSATAFRSTTVNGEPTRLTPQQRVTMTEGRRTTATPSGVQAGGSGFSVCVYRSSC